MNTKQPDAARTRSGAFLAAIIMLGLAACSETSQETEAAAQGTNYPMAGAAIGGDFALTDAAGDIITDDSLKGRWRLIYFGYTFCPDVCPVDAERMGRAYRLVEQAALAAAGNLVPIFISVDPERDTPEIAGEFAANFHPKMLGLSGSPDAVQQAVDAYRIYASKADAREDGFYLVDHSAYIYLMDADGKPVNIYARDVSPEDMAKDIERWMTS
ncbi:SCO family protein [Pacificimonas sp. WHA3]|uniref:SCO family protein n=1 Tax=Pacificimonas pallii TaxID=2827236 RepID=A0ABS6SBE9_9SPHN|nr:SCO family protein [Pacificimonas pallii]MBV7255740.1 SCO family protein [Pacificimonas pallii]